MVSTLGEVKASWQQQIELKASQMYEFSFWINANKGVSIALYMDDERLALLHT